MFILAGLIAVAFAAPHDEVEVEVEAEIEKAQYPWQHMGNGMMGNYYGNHFGSQYGQFPVDYSKLLTVSRSIFSMNFIPGRGCSNSCNCQQVCAPMVPCHCMCPPPCREQFLRFIRHK